MWDVYGMYVMNITFTALAVTALNSFYNFIAQTVPYSYS